VARACDVTWVTSDAERELLQDAVPNVDVQVVPTVYEGSAEGLPFDERSGLLFVGGFEHAPNVDAVLWFVREIWPAARKQLPPRVVLTIVGSKVPPEIFDLESPETNVVGHVPDLTEYFRRCRLSIAPLRFGAGLKGKVHQSLVRGLPCVTTTIGAEGLGLTSGENILIADDPDAFSRAVASLYQDRSSWERLAAAGRRHMEESFGLERVAAVVRDLLR
jgi:glycosyltransferase involved in cell wall biosynthesis